MTHQDDGGFVPKSLFAVEKYEDYWEISEISGSLASIQGMAVDYLVRFMMSKNVHEAFDISIKGAIAIDHMNGNNNEYHNILRLLDGVTGLDEESIKNACKIVCYDTAYRRGPMTFQPPENIEWNQSLYSNIKILVERTLFFLEQKGPVIKDGFTFEGGYTDLVSRGDGDYLTKDMLIDLKVSKHSFSTKWSLQLLMYFILGIHSVYTEFQTIDKLCIFNPYLNQSCICEIKDISDKTKYTVCGENRQGACSGL